MHIKRILKVYSVSTHRVGLALNLRPAGIPVASFMPFYTFCFFFLFIRHKGSRRSCLTVNDFYVLLIVRRGRLKNDHVCIGIVKFGFSLKCMGVFISMYIISFIFEWKLRKEYRKFRQLLC